MQVPIRKGDKVPRPKADPFMTEDKFRELQAKVQKWKTVNRPREAAEVARLALMGDFSENVGYQVAKGRLRGLNQRIIDTENLLARAEIIPLDEATDQIRLGHYVTIESLETDENKKAAVRQPDENAATNNNRQKTYQILGSSETNPTVGVISHSSPLGAALLGRRSGDIIEINLNGQTKQYRIVKIAKK
jgi:transcription elongation factor GreA